MIRAAQHHDQSLSRVRRVHSGERGGGEAGWQENQSPSKVRRASTHGAGRWMVWDIRV